MYNFEVTSTINVNGGAFFSYTRSHETSRKHEVPIRPMDLAYAQQVKKTMFLHFLHPPNLDNPPTYGSRATSHVQHPIFKVQPLIDNRPFAHVVLGVQRVVLGVLPYQIPCDRMAVPDHEIVIDQDGHGVLGVELQQTHPHFPLPTTPNPGNQHSLSLFLPRRPRRASMATRPGLNLKFDERRFPGVD